MPVSLTTLTGPIYMPNGATPIGGRVSFELSSWDREEGEALIVSGPTYSNIDENGQFSVELFTTTEGVNTVNYRMYVLWEDSTLSQSYVNDVYVSSPVPHYTKKYIGSFALAGAGPFQVSDLNIISELELNSFDVLLECQAYALVAEEAAAASAADRLQTGLDTDITAADRVQTGLDRVATAADSVATGLDADATAADRVQTGLDVLASSVARNLAQAWAESPTEPDGPGTKSAKTSAEEAEAARDEILGLTANATTLAPGALATVSYNPGTGVLELGVPAGAKGDNGVDGTGTVNGPVSSVTNRLAAFDGTTGKLLKDSGTLTTDFATAASVNTQAVADLTALAALDTAQWKATIVQANGATYIWTPGNWSAEITALDPAYVASDANPTGTLGAWVIAIDPTLEALAALDATTGLIVQTGAATFTKLPLAELAPENYITPRDFNPSAGTGGDDTAAVAAAMASDLPMYIDRTYIISAAVTHSTSAAKMVYGNGPSTSRITMTNATQDGLVKTGGCSLTVEGISVTTSVNKTAGAAVKTSGTYKDIIRDCHIFGPSASLRLFVGIDINGLIPCVENNYILTCTSIGLKIGNTASGEGSEGIVSGNTFNTAQSGNTAIAINWTSGLRTLRVFANIIQNYAYGMNVAPATGYTPMSLDFFGNVLEANSVGGLVCTLPGGSATIMDAVIITGNQFNESTGAAIILTGATNFIRIVNITGNVFDMGSTGQLSLGNGLNVNICSNTFVSANSAHIPIQLSASLPVATFIGSNNSLALTTLYAKNGNTGAYKSANIVAA